MLALGIVLVWLGVVATHVRREYFKPPELRMELGARTLAPGSQHYTVRMAGQATGLGSSRLDTIADGFVLEEMMMLDVPAQDEHHRAVTRTELELSRGLALRTFRFSLDSDIGRYVVHGEVEADTLLVLEVAAGTEPERIEVPLDGDLMLPAAVPLRLAAAGELRVGEARRVRLFDPSTLDGRDVEIRITGRDTLIVADTAIHEPESGRWRTGSEDTVAVWRIEEHFGGVSVSSWLDEDGRLVRAESPMGLTLERTAYELARQEWDAARTDPERAAGYGAIIESTAIASNLRLARPDEADGTERLAVRLLGVELEGLDLAGGRQELRGDTLWVRQEDAGALSAGYRLPYQGGGEASEELGSTPLIQSTDPRIMDQARRIAGSEEDPEAVARLIGEWVYGALEKEITPSLPSAVQVLESRRGDCNEHTVLYVALARSLGLPTRTAAGLVHLDGRFFYHAWPEVWLGGEWVAVDPTLDQHPADATHLRFVVGGLARQVELVRLIGRLQLEVVE